MTRLHQSDHLSFRRTPLFLLHHSLLACCPALLLLSHRNKTPAQALGIYTPCRGSMTSSAKRRIGSRETPCPLSRICVTPRLTRGCNSSSHRVESSEERGHRPVMMEKACTMLAGSRP